MIDITKHYYIDSNGCWIWKGNIRDTGYGYARIARKSVRAHIIVYKSLVGKIPEGMILNHICNNRSCVNPDHLEPITRKENTRKGKVPVITFEIAAEIKKLYKEGANYTALATRYKLSRGHVWCIVNKYWS